MNFKNHCLHFSLTRPFFYCKNQYFHSMDRKPPLVKFWKTPCILTSGRKINLFYVSNSLSFQILENIMYSSGRKINLFYVPNSLSFRILENTMYSHSRKSIFSNRNLNRKLYLFVLRKQATVNLHCR